MCLVVLAFSVSPGLLQAQDRTSSSSSGLLNGAANPLAQMRQRLGQSGSSGTMVPMEGPVDAAVYLVGPGDLFNLSIGGLDGTVVTVPVTADGHLVLPEAGSLLVAGLSLATVRERAVAAMRRSFENVELTLTLAQPRHFYVHVSGAVPAPGRYLAMPVARVSSVLELSFADSTQAAVSNLSYRPSLRNVTLLRRDSTERSLDLLRYFVSGDTRQNPYLQDGDVLHVPAYDPQVSSVFVDGPLPFAGAYDYRPGDTVRDLLSLAAGDQGLRAMHMARLTRRSADGSVETQSLDVQALLAGTTPPVPLQPLDHVSLVQDHLPGGIVTVEGAVPYPGTYPIAQGHTTLQDLLSLAGGLREDALPRAAFLERHSLPEPRAVLRPQNRFETGNSPTEFLRQDSTAILQRLRLSNFDLLSRTYFTQELRLQNRVSIDLEAALRDNGTAIYLRDGDRLVVPRDQQTVFVFGEVIRPGYVPYQPGQGAEGYLAAAGGRAPLATDLYVIDAGTGAHHTAGTIPIYSGDTIFVDRRQDSAVSIELQRLLYEERRIRSERRARTVQTVIQTLGIVGTVLSTYLIIQSTN